MLGRKNGGKKARVYIRVKLIANFGKYSRRNRGLKSEGKNRQLSKENMKLV